MGDLLTPLKTTRKVKSNVEELETLALNSGARSGIEVIEVSSTSRNRASKQDRHKKQDSTAFLHKSYLQNDSSHETLPDDAREILKKQPDLEEFLAVLQYLRFGIDGKHDFNIRASGPKQSILVHTVSALTQQATVAVLDVDNDVIVTNSYVDSSGNSESPTKSPVGSPPAIPTCWAAEAFFTGPGCPPSG